MWITMSEPCKQQRCVSDQFSPDNTPFISWVVINFVRSCWREQCESKLLLLL
jgi:hypothetical protein